jgi:hypothetical protein
MFLTGLPFPILLTRATLAIAILYLSGRHPSKNGFTVRRVAPLGCCHHLYATLYGENYYRRVVV